jgi:hypothetical protein
MVPFTKICVRHKRRYVLNICSFLCGKFRFMLSTVLQFPKFPLCVSVNLGRHGFVASKLVTIQCFWNSAGSLWVHAHQLLWANKSSLIVVSSYAAFLKSLFGSVSEPRVLCLYGPLDYILYLLEKYSSILFELHELPKLEAIWGTKTASILFGLHELPKLEATSPIWGTKNCCCRPQLSFILHSQSTANATTETKNVI